MQSQSTNQKKITIPIVRAPRSLFDVWDPSLKVSVQTGYGYSVVSIKQAGGNKQTGGNKRTGGQNLLHEKELHGREKIITWKNVNRESKKFKIVKQPSSLNRYYRVSQPYDRMDHRN